MFENLPVDSEHAGNAAVAAREQRLYGGRLYGRKPVHDFFSVRQCAEHVLKKIAPRPMKVFSVAFIGNYPDCPGIFPWFDPMGSKRRLHEGSPRERRNSGMPILIVAL
jgi:hypothetical protein